MKKIIGFILITPALMMLVSLGIPQFTFTLPNILTLFLVTLVICSFFFITILGIKLILD